MAGMSDGSSLSSVMGLPSADRRVPRDAIRSWTSSMQKIEWRYMLHPERHLIPGGRGFPWLPPSKTTLQKNARCVIWTCDASLRPLARVGGSPEASATVLRGDSIGGGGASSVCCKTNKPRCKQRSVR